MNNTNAGYILFKAIRCMLCRAFSFALILSLFTLSCIKSKQPLVNFSGFAQGSTYNITFLNKKNSDPSAIKLKVEKILYDFDMSLSLYKDSSILSRINRNEEVVPDTFFTEVFNKSVTISEMTDGAFDITVGPLVNAWGFGPDAHRNFRETERDSLLSLVGMKKVSLINGKIIKSNPKIMLDVNAIAQGYSVDVICRFFDSIGITDYLVEIGGEVKARGSKAGAAWRIGIDKPVDNNNFPGQTLQAIIELTDRALATSGNYRKFFIEDGIKYSHEIDPRTGYPVKNTLLSVSIEAADCATADGIATACMVMGKDKTIEFIGKHQELDAYLIYSDNNGNFRTWISEKLRGKIEED